MNRHFRSFSQAGIALSLALLVLVLDAMAACPALHEPIHHDADEPGHECAVTLFAHGKVDSASIEISVATPPAPIEPEPQVIFSGFAPAIQNLPAGRAPPFSSAVS